MKIGFIGLGIMGKPMAKNLLKAGYTDLLVNNRSQAPVQELEAAGAKGAAKQEIGAQCDVVITMLPNSPQVKEVMLGEDGETEADLAFVLTEEDGSYTLDGAMNEVDDGKEKPILTVKGVLNSADSKADGWLAMLADENQITFTYTGSTEGDQTERLVSLYARENAVAITELAASERPLFSLRVTTSENADDSVLKAIESATAENAVQPLQMSDDELTEYLTSISTNATQVLYTVLSKLPSSVIELLTATNGN